MSNYPELITIGFYLQLTTSDLSGYHKTDIYGRRKVMASGKEYLEFVLEQLSSLDGISYKAMMGEYIIYYQGKIVGGIYDDRFLVKPVEAAKQMMPDERRTKCH